jgi:hypothetical protein
VLRLDDGLPADHANRWPIVGGRQRPAPPLGRVGRLGLDPVEGDLVPVEEVAQLGDGGIPAVADDDRARRRRRGGDPREAARPRHAVAREPSDLGRELWRRGHDGVVIARLEPHHAGRRRGAEADGVRHTERDRHLADDVPRMPLTEHPLDAVHDLDGLDEPVQQAEERGLVALVRRVLARSEGDVRGRAGESLDLERSERLKDADRPDVVGGHHVRGFPRTFAATWRTELPRLSMRQS